MQVVIPATCGNAPRHQIITELMTAIHTKDLSTIRSWFADDASWEIIGVHNLSGLSAIEEWVHTLPQTASLEFLSVLTHGKEGSADGVITTGRDLETRFSHVLQFASAGKNAKLKRVRSYFIGSFAESKQP